MAAAPRGSRPGDRFVVRRLGSTNYESTWRAMQAFTDARNDDTADEVWLTEHPPIYTLGLAGRREHLLRDRHIRVLKVDRGGQITYHGPGQLVAYLLIDLERRGLGIRRLVRAIESAVIEFILSYGVSARVRAGAPGVYVDLDGIESKVAALGLKVRRGCTYHGLAINVDMDLSPFADIDPCGYPGMAVTQLKDIGVVALPAEIQDRLVRALRTTIDAASSDD